MTESEAKLRIQQSFKHGSEIKLRLDQLNALVQKRQVSHKLKPNFVGPYDASIAKSRWNKCCISATKQLYGTNHNVSSIKQQLNTNRQDIFMLRLIAQTSSKCNIMLKSLLQFPEQLQSDADEPVVVRVAAVCSDLLALLALAGILDTDVTNSVQKEETGVAGSNDTSLVESEVIQTLHDEGRVSKHLADLARERLGNETADSSAMTAGVSLGSGCTLHLLHDSLSNRLAAKAARSKPVPMHKYTIRKSNPVRPSVKNGILKSKKAQQISHKSTKPITSSTAANKQTLVTSTTKRRSSVGNSSKKTVLADRIKSRSKVHRTEKTSDKSGAFVEEFDVEQRERERLWKELMPLLANQDVVLHSNDEHQHDWWVSVDHLDQLLVRAITLQTEVQATQQLLADCDTHQDSSATNSSDLDTAIQEANTVLQRMGFLPPLSTESSPAWPDFGGGGTHDPREDRLECAVRDPDYLDRRKGEPSRDNKGDTGQRQCLCNRGDDLNVSDVHGRCCSNCIERADNNGDDVSSSGGLNEVRRVREEFWSGLAASGHVET